MAKSGGKGSKGNQSGKFQNGKRTIIIKRHFRERWHAEIGDDSDGVIKRRLHSALKNKTLRRTLNGFAVNVDGCKAVCVISPDGAWIFITLLRPGMRLKVGEAAGEAGSGSRDEVAAGMETVKEGAAH